MATEPLDVERFKTDADYRAKRLALIRSGQQSPRPAMTVEEKADFFALIYERIISQVEIEVGQHVAAREQELRDEFDGKLEKLRTELSNNNRSWWR